MVNPEHLERLKLGVAPWNAWREQHPEIRPDLRDAHLNRTRLNGADLRGADLCHALLRKTDLRGADLRGANLSHAKLSWSDLRGAHLSGSCLNSTRLIQADLRGAHLNGASLNDAHLNGADLSNADLAGARLNNADLSNARTSSTTFARLDLRRVKGLTAIDHFGPSHIDLYTVQLSPDDGARHFLRGCGVPNEWIYFYMSTMMHPSEWVNLSMPTMMPPVNYHSCFISYSHKDRKLASRLHTDLQKRGVCCWFAPEDMGIGDEIRPCIERAILLQDKLLLLLSKHALASKWVEAEVEAALDRESTENRKILLPIRLDNAVIRLDAPVWAKHLRRHINIGDFTHWTESTEYQRAFERLLRDLKKSDEQGREDGEH